MKPLLAGAATGAWLAIGLWNYSMTHANAVCWAIHTDGKLWFADYLADAIALAAGPVATLGALFVRDSCEGFFRPKEDSI